MPVGIDCRPRGYEKGMMTTDLTWPETTRGAEPLRADVALPPAVPVTADIPAESSAPTSPTDATLVTRAIGGDADAFGQLYEQHADGVYHFVHFRVQDPALAEDLTHDVWVRALDHIGQLDAPERLRSWLLTIAHRTVLNHWRGQSSRPLPADRRADTDVAGEAVAPAVEDADLAAVGDRLDAARVLEAAARLTDLQRQAIALRFVAGFSLAETAAAMDRSIPAVKNLQHHALAALRRHLDFPAGEP